MPLNSNNDMASRPLPSFTIHQQGPQVQGQTQAGDGSTVNQAPDSSNNLSFYYNATPNEKRQILDRIDHAEGAAFDDIGVQARKCVEGTREDLLETIYKWAEGTHDTQSQDKRGFWLQGLAGTGKSTVARTVAEYLSNNGYPVASFFFRRGEEGRSSPKKFVTTILRQLAHYDELFGPLMKKYNEMGSAKKFLETEWRLFIKEPLAPLPHEQVFLVIDAIDESREMMAADYMMFSLLSDPTNFEGLNLRIFVTARPGEQKENENFNHVFKLHDIPESIVEEDLQRYFRARFEEMDPDSDEDEFPEDHHIRELARRSKPLFIAAKTSFDFISQHGRDPEDQYDLLVRSKMEKTSNFEDSERAYIALDQMYLLVIKEALTKRSHSGGLIIPTESWADFRHYVGSLITLQRGFSHDALAILLDVARPRLRRFLKAFRTVLDIPRSIEGSIHIFHQSFPDFLKSARRVEFACRGEAFNHEELWINELDANSLILKSCLDLMSGSRQGIGLRENLCGLPGPGPVKDMAGLCEKVNPTLTYACKYWVSHFQMATISEDTETRVYAFLSHHLLHWIEAMACLNCLSDAIRQMDEIHTCVQNTSQTAIRAFVADAKRFVGHSKEFIDKSPLQIYSSALLFAPENSLVKIMFADCLKRTLPRHSPMKDEWDAKLLEFSDHEPGIISHHFSADGERIASLDIGKNLIVWEAGTGNVLWRAEGIRCIDVSLDLQKGNCTLAGADGQGNIIIWPNFDKSSRYCLAYGEGAELLAFSSDGNRLVWVDHNEQNPLIVRSADRHNAVEQLPKDGLPTEFQFGEGLRTHKLQMTKTPQDGYLVALCGAVSRLECVAVWEKTGHRPWSFHGTFDCRPEKVVDFALASKWLVYLSIDKLHFWNVESRHLQAIPLHWKSTISYRLLAHTPGSSCIIAPDKDGGLSRYELGSLLTVNRLPESQGDLFDMALSGDGKTLACSFDGGLSNGMIRLWDIDSANLDCVAVPSGYQSSLGILNLSGDAKRIAVSSHESISLFDCGLFPLQEQQQPERPERASWMDTCFSLSPDGSLAAYLYLSPGTRAFTSEDLGAQHCRWSATVWELDSGASRSFLSSTATESVETYGQSPHVFFSPDCKRLVMLFRNSIGSQVWVETWHLDTERRCGFGTVRGSYSKASPAAFSVDSQLLSFVFQDTEGNPKVGVLNLCSTENTSLVSHSFPQAASGDRALGVSPFGPSGFRAALAKKTPELDWSDEPNPIVQAYTCSWSSMSSSPNLTLPTSGLPLTGPYAAAISSQATSPILAFQSHSPESIVCFLSNRGWEFRRVTPRFTPSGRSRSSLCQEGNCLTTDEIGTLFLPPPQHSVQVVRCPCGSLPLCKMSVGIWIFCQQRPLLRLPYDLIGAQISEANGTILITSKGNRLLHWIKLSRNVREELATQSTSQHYVSPYLPIDGPW